MWSANPRANHTLRTLPPSSSAEWDSMWDKHNQCHCWGNFQGQQKTSLQREVSRLSPLRWISQKNPAVVEKVVRVMVKEECLAELRSASEKQDREGFWWRPTWQDLRGDSALLRPPKKVIQVKGVMTGNIGLLPFPILTSGRRPCCTARQLLVGLAPTLDTTLV